MTEPDLSATLLASLSSENKPAKDDFIGGRSVLCKFCQHWYIHPCTDATYANCPNIIAKQRRKNASSLCNSQFDIITFRYFISSVGGVATDEFANSVSLTNASTKREYTLLKPVRRPTIRSKRSTIDDGSGAGRRIHEARRYSRCNVSLPTRGRR